jgi:hypothetical protein
VNEHPAARLRLHADTMATAQWLHSWPLRSDQAGRICVRPGLAAGVRMTNAERTIAPLEEPIETGPKSGALGLVSDMGSWTPEFICR